ncbi:MAG: hypothetical protein KF744_13190 [Taibaiella sp.]|nr:hypothetical protein [Taibaiella sp.]
MRWLNILLRIILISAGLAMVLCCWLVVFIFTHKDQVVSAVEEQLREHINGELRIMHPEVRVAASFPGVAISLHRVEIRDSLWSQHHRTLLKADHFFILLNPLPLITGKVRIGEVEMRAGQVCLYTDTTGYSNMSAFRRNKKGGKGKTPEIDNVLLTDMRIIIVHQAKNKDFNFEVKHLAAKRKHVKDGWKATVALSADIHSMAFNTEKGSFLEGKHLEAKLKCTYDKKEDAITLPLQELRINKESIDTRGKFSFREGEPARFELYFGSKGIRYKEALSLITKGISRKIPEFDFADRVAVQATLIGHAAYLDTPHVHVSWQVRDNTFTTPAGTVTHCSFLGSYDNERVHGAGHKDPNALITVRGLKGIWEGIDVTVDTLSIADLINPVLEGRLTARADMAKLNKVAGESAFLFKAGSLQTDIAFKGSLEGLDTAKPYIMGMLRIDNAALVYKPRGVTLTNTNARIRFAGDDVIADTLTLSCGTSSMGLHGTFKNFLHLYFTSPEKIVMNWDVKSRSIDLTELLPLLKAPEYKVRKERGNHVSMIPQQLGAILANNEISLNVSVDKLMYQDFAATDISCRLALDSAGFRLTDAKLNHANGIISANARVRQEKVRNRYEVDAKVQHVSVKQFFKAFHDFGQGAVTHDEIGGILDADVHATGYLDSDGKPVKRSVTGEATVSLKEGSLVAFAPMKVIGTLLFRRRQMDSIAFREISDRLTIKEGRIFVPPLHIESSAINLMVKGVYATTGKGTNLEIDVPLRNPAKDSMITDEALRHARHMKGLVLHLRATKDDDGDLKIRFR